MLLESRRYFSDEMIYSDTLMTIPFVLYPETILLCFRIQYHTVPYHTNQFSHHYLPQYKSCIIQESLTALKICNCWIILYCFITSIRYCDAMTNNNDISCIDKYLENISPFQCVRFQWLLLCLLLRIVNLASLKNLMLSLP